MSHSTGSEALVGLSGTAGLSEARALMARLSGARDRVGTIAQEHVGSGGKQVRARLALAAAEVLALDRVAMAPWAAACELLHAASLVHDDVQDGDSVRRGRPSVWAAHGLAQAINAGDLLLVLPVLAIDELVVPDALKWRLSRAAARRAAQTVRGQSEELDLLSSGRLQPEAWEACARGKAGELLALPVEGAALASGLGEEASQRLSEPFALLGILYQAVDDCLDLYGDKGRGAVGNDLREGKVSRLVVEHLRLHPSDREALLGLLGASRAQTPDEEVSVWLERFRAGGALGACGQYIEELRARVLQDPSLRAIPALRELACGLLDRVCQALPGP